MTEQQIRIVLVEDDADVAGFIAAVLGKRLDADVRVLGSASGLLESMREFAPDLLLTDVELPGISGLDLIQMARGLDPDLPVIVMTAHASVDYAVRALRAEADEFLQKPVDTKQLVDTVQTLVNRARLARTSRQSRSVLAIGAHPDDIEIGVGATLAAHAAAGDTITLLTLSRGGRGGDADNRQHESLASAELLGARLFMEDLEDTHIPNADPTVGIIERVIAEVQPSIVYTHTRHDRHQDHRAVHDASLVATRRVDNVACYQSPSATIDFRPSRFVTVDDFVERKLQLLQCFSSQTGLRDYLEPDFVVATARYWSRFGTGRMSEPLEVIRDSTGFTGSGIHHDRINLESMGGSR